MNVTISNADTRNVTVTADAVIGNIARSKSYPSYMKECDFTSSSEPFMVRATSGANIEDPTAALCLVTMSNSNGVIGQAQLGISSGKQYPRIGIYDAARNNSILETPTSGTVNTSLAFGYGEMEFSARLLPALISSSSMFVGVGYSLTHAGAHSGHTGLASKWENACCFGFTSLSSNWYVIHGSDFSISGIDTGLSATDAMHFLSINVSADGNTAKFYIDGNLVQTLTDPGDESVFARDDMRACIEFRDAQATSVVGSVYVDYMRNAIYKASR
jgi:hypothetical protein